MVTLMKGHTQKGGSEQGQWPRVLSSQWL